MKSACFRLIAACAMFAVVMVRWPHPRLRRAGRLLSNNNAAATAADFAARMPATFLRASTRPALCRPASLQSSFDVLLVFEDGRYPNASAVGDVAAAFANAGRRWSWDVLRPGSQ
jgi:hypothetical protein